MNCFMFVFVLSLHEFCTHLVFFCLYLLILFPKNHLGRVLSLLCVTDLYIMMRPHGGGRPTIPLNEKAWVTSGEVILTRASDHNRTCQKADVSLVHFRLKSDNEDVEKSLKYNSWVKSFSKCHNSGDYSGASQIGTHTKNRSSEETAKDFFLFYIDVDNPEDIEFIANENLPQTSHETLVWKYDDIVHQCPINRISYVVCKKCANTSGCKTIKDCENLCMQCFLWKNVDLGLGSEEWLLRFRNGRGMRYSRHLLNVYRHDLVTKITEEYLLGAYRADCVIALKNHLHIKIAWDGEHHFEETKRCYDANNNYTAVFKSDMSKAQTFFHLHDGLLVRALSWHFGLGAEMPCSFTYEKNPPMVVNVVAVHTLLIEISKQLYDLMPPPKKCMVLICVDDHDVEIYGRHISAALKQQIVVIGLHARDVTCITVNDFRRVGRHHLRSDEIGPITGSSLRLSCYNYQVFFNIACPTGIMEPDLSTLTSHLPLIVRPKTPSISSCPSSFSMGGVSSSSSSSSGDGMKQSSIGAFMKPRPKQSDEDIDGKKDPHMVTHDRIMSAIHSSEMDMDMNISIPTTTTTNTAITSSSSSSSSSSFSSSTWLANEEDMVMNISVPTTTTSNTNKEEQSPIFIRRRRPGQSRHIVVDDDDDDDDDGVIAETTSTNTSSFSLASGPSTFTNKENGTMGSPMKRSLAGVDELSSSKKPLNNTTNFK